ncbi:COG4315 family predicted lipoprotein [Pseudomonas matsuisoli]|uniref:Lipoprotein with Yx(FWY)xxD motif n=1 Tax=Pseudomonas matsuisoli TaxID=1515666 RepID=A0A917PYZ3_9PSED|nr:hypothetical protein [Pseudomonas matsuisoli]GGK00756.1 hypothetical protein GCM10009304_28260 [Pseudomonas matsuisoli]
MKLHYLLAGALLATAGTAFAQDHAGAPGMEKDGILVDHKGMTLYTYDKDDDGKSMCNDKCAENWPPLKAEHGAKPMGEWTIITRNDGSMQWAYDGDPLYTYAKDAKAGDRTGDGKADGDWDIAEP